MKTRFLLAATAASFAFAGAAYAAGPGPYVALGVGMYAPTSTDVDTRIPTRAFATRPLSYNIGWGALGAIGYKWDQGYRTELEIGYRQAAFNDFNGSGTSGHQGTFGVMGNLLFDIGGNAKFQPYLGGGVGAAWTKWHHFQASASTAYPTGTPMVDDSSPSAFQYQGIAGVSMPMNENTDFYAEYRYIGVQRLKFESTAPVGSTFSRIDDHSHNVMVGIRFSFGKPMEKKVAAAAVAPPPPPPPVPQKFLVFFDFDRANLRADALKIVAEAAEYAKKGGKAVISVTGHTDTAGTDAYNLGLSERRAKAVQAELAKLGFTANQIQVSYKGESSPLIATGDGVREPQNRRVEIVMP